MTLKGRVDMKKFLSFISAMAICTSCFSCSNKNSSVTSEPSKAEAQSFAAEKLSGIAYKKSTVELPENMGMIFSIKPFNGSSEYFIIGSTNDSSGFWITDADFTSFREIALSDADPGNSYDCDITDDGTIVRFVSTENDGFHLTTHSLDGALLSDEYVKEYYTDSDDMAFITGMTSDGNTVVVCINGTFEVFTMDGTYISSITLNDGETAENVGKDSSGRLICAVRTADDKLELRPITPDGMTVESSVTYDLPETIYAEIEPGYGEYSMFLRSMTTIYGIKRDDLSAEPLFSINIAGLSADSVAGAAMGSDGNFTIPVLDFSNGTSYVKKYIPCDPEELKNIPVITVGMTWQRDDVVKMADLFNEEHSDVRVEMKIYDSNDIDKRNDEITQDALSGNLPDMIVGTDLGSFDLVKNEALCDLYEFMDKDDELNRHSFIPNYLSEIDRKYGGHIYNIPNGFRITLPYTAKTKFVKDIDKWNITAYLDMIESMPEGMLFDNINACIADTQTRRDRLGVGFWIDYDSLKCRFDTPEFARYIEYCKKGTPDSENYEDVTAIDNERYKWLNTAYIDENILFNDVELSCYSNYLRTAKHTFGGEDFSFMGEIDGSGTPVMDVDFSNALSITKNCKNKDAAWEFIKTFYTDSYYKNNYENFSYFPVTVSGMEQFRELEKAPKVYKYDENLKDYGGIAAPTGESDENGNAIYDKLGYVDDEIISQVDSLIEKARLPKEKASLPSPGGSFDDLNRFYTEFYGIYNEELDRFFHDEITAEECGYLLQNRYSIYLSENFG